MLPRSSRSLSLLPLLALILAASRACSGCDEPGGAPPPAGPSDAASEPELGPGHDSVDEDASQDVSLDASPSPDVPPDTGPPCEIDCAALPLPEEGCLRAVCNPTTGACDLHPLPLGAPCDDGKACTVDACDESGQCEGKLDCPVEGPCVEALCAADGGCATKTRAGPCDDGNLCTKDDQCAFKACNGVPLDVETECDDGDPCTQDGCLPAKGCTHAAAAPGGPCDDGDPCTASDTCDTQGACVGKGAVDCDDGDPCTEDGCGGGQGGCVHVPKQEGAACDDGSKCTEGDVCSGGACTGQLIDKAKPSSICTQLLCDPKTAVVTVVQGPDGALCSDGEPCTVADACKQGQCVGKTLQCAQGNPCQDDKCDPTTGNCKATPKPDGASCDDGDACSSSDACKAGACVGQPYGETGQCDDGKSCTSDACAPQLGCYHLPKAGQPCDDGDACTLKDVCVAGACVGEAKACDDGQPCTADGCAKGSCVHELFVGPCDDGDACTLGEICSAGKCGGAPLDCDDDNPCTKDGCAPKSGCWHLPLAGGTPCQDGLSCTEDDKCDGGKCKGVDKCVSCVSDLHCLPFAPPNPCLGKLRCVASFKGKVCAIEPGSEVHCPATGDPCAVNACDPKVGKCKLTLKQVGLPCSSGDKCHQGETCNAKGACVGPGLLCDDGEPCTDDACQPGLGCVHTPRPEGVSCTPGDPQCWPGASCKAGKCQGKNVCTCTSDAACAKYDDGDLCNGVVRCLGVAPGQPGACALDPASLVSCPKLGGQPCVANLCQSKTGKCLPTPVPDGGKCDDDHACTVMETCKGGKCQGIALQCDEGQPCTFYVCDKVFGCAQGPMPEGAKCDDGNPCSAKDHCAGGKCVGSEGECDDGNPCTIDLCDKAQGGCASLVEQGAKCDDGDPCTTGDACLDGACQAKALGCEDGDDCTIDACLGKGGCKHVLVPGKDCSDGDPCTTGDACGKAGGCGGKPRLCDDGNACTAQACKGGACVVTALSGLPCDDGSKCTQGDTCDSLGACVSVPVQCDDGNPCTAVVGACTAKNGCAIVPSDGKACNDGDLCTIADKCGGGACQGIALLCDDGNACTDDACDPKLGCVNKANLCSDGNDCTLDKCDPPPPWGKGKGCVHVVIDGFQICKDGDACTHQGVCQGTKCQTKPLSCDDGDPCTVDGCDKVEGCMHLPVEDTATVCDDGDACTQDHCDGQGGCEGVKQACDDGNPCTQDVCDVKKGCLSTDLKEGALCDDGCPCTKGETCQSGSCSGGKVTCPSCPKGKVGACAVFDDNDKCNGSFVCVTGGPCAGVVGAGAGVCQLQQAQVVCDPTSDKPCVKSQCDPMTGACVPKALPEGAACDDNAPCTVGDVCQGGVCQAGPPADCSKLADACNDAICAADPGAAQGYSCVALPRSGTAVGCDADGDGCTAGDHCDQGVCVAGTAVDCKGVGGPCQLASCVPTATGGFTCKVTAMPDKSPCEDGQLCTVGDACKAGSCVGGGGVHDCGGLDGPCASYACDPKGNGGAGACAPEAKNQGGPCDADGNGCTVKDHCDQGVCQPGALPDCSDKTGPCTLGACKSTGAAYVCVATPRNELAPCEADGDGCTEGDHCEGGKCEPGKAKDCSAFSGSGGCVVGTCVSVSASHGDCKGVPAPAGTPCDADGSGCTAGDACNKDGACMSGKPIDCLAFTGSCATGKCVPSKDSPTDFGCVGAPKADGSACDADGDGCTVGDRCQAGQCVAGKAPDCSGQAQGPCVVGGCKSKGSDGHLCVGVPRPDGTVCDADGDGCTEGDACTGGVCVKGALQTCAEFASLCASSSCKSGGSAKFTCVVQPKESWPPLAPPSPCTPTDKPPGCPAHYTCSPQKDGGAGGYCTPAATIFCDDGSSCTGQDVCVQGVCKAGPPKDCDDDNACTLDLCAAGKCTHQAIAGCSLCIEEDFDAKPPPGQTASLGSGWAADSPAPKWLSFALSAAHTWAGSAYSLRAKWQGPAPDNPSGVVRARLRHARLYMRPDAPPPVLGFRLAMKVADQGCAKDVLRVEINDQPVWQKCDDTAFSKLAGGFEKVLIDLTPWRGAAIDVSWTVLAGADKQGAGLIDIDRIRLSGACSEGCLGVDFEVHDPDGIQPASPPRLPAAMRLEATAPAWLGWEAVAKGGHTGAGALRAAWSGAPPGGKAQEAAFVLPGIRPSVGARLRFAVRAPSLGQAGCDAGALSVSVGGKVVAQVCASAPLWKIHDVDLGPWVGKVVDLRVRVLSGKGPGGGGEVWIDDIAVSGACTWTCFEERFDGDLGRWTKSAQGGGSMAWAQVADKALSPPKSVFAGHDASAKAAQSAQLLGRADKRAAFMVPVRGADYSFAVNLHMLVGPDGKTDLCDVAGDAPNSPLQVSLRRLAAAPPPDQPVPVATPATPTDDDFSTVALCKSTSGWQVFKGKLGAIPGAPDPRGVVTVPALTARTLGDGGQLKAWVDELVFTCH